MQSQKIFKIKIFSSLLIALILCVSFTFIKPTLAFNEYEKETFWINKTYPNFNYNTLLLGDSRVYRGLNPIYFSDEKSPANLALNAAYSSAGFSEDYINYFIKASKRKIKIILFGIAPNEFTEGACSNDHFREYRDNTATDIFIKKMIYPYFNSLNVYSFKKLYDCNLNREKMLVEVFNDAGFVSSSMNRIDSSYANQSYINNFTKEKISEKRISNFLNLIKNLSYKGIMCIAVEMPIARQLKLIEDSLSGYNRLDMKEKFKSNGGIWIENINEANDEFVTFDGSHLAAASANKFSEKLSKKIQLLNYAK